MRVDAIDEDNSVINNFYSQSETFLQPNRNISAVNQKHFCGQPHKITPAEGSVTGKYH